MKSETQDRSYSPINRVQALYEAGITHRLQDLSLQALNPREQLVGQGGGVMEGLNLGWMGICGEFASMEPHGEKLVEMASHGP